MSENISPDKIYLTLTGQEAEEPKEKPKLSLTTGNSALDDMLRFRGKYVRIQASVIEARANSSSSYSMNQYIPVQQLGIIVYGRVSDVVLYHFSKAVYGSEYPLGSINDTGDWIYLGFCEAYVENPNEYTKDLLDTFSTHYPYEYISVDGNELKELRIPAYHIESITEIAEEDSPLARRHLGPPKLGKYDKTYGF